MACESVADTPAALAGLGCRAAPSRTARAAAPATVNIGFFTETKPTMLAKGEGWFESGAGGKLSWTEMGSGADINTAITAGSCDIGLATGSAATAAGIAQGLPFQLIGMVDNIGPAEEMTVRTAANIKTAADFKGKKVATPFGSTSHFRLLGFLKTNGLTQRDVTVLDMKAAAIVAAWSRGEIDAAYVWAPAKSKILADGGAVFPTYEALDKAGYVIADLIVVRNGFAQQYPDAVVGFLKAYGRALAMYRPKPDDRRRRRQAGRRDPGGGAGGHEGVRLRAAGRAGHAGLAGRHAGRAGQVRPRAEGHGRLPGGAAQHQDRPGAGRVPEGDQHRASCSKALA